MTGKCPTCNQPVDTSSESRPFCSERCRLIDLGEWLEGNYQVEDTNSDYSDVTSESLGSRTKH